MKMPNGYGSVTKLSGNRRNPWVVRVTTHLEYDEQNDKYSQKRAVLGYFPTRKDALNALADYSKSPFDPYDSAITFSQLYDRWKDRNYGSLSASTKTSRESAYKYCEPLYNRKIKDIRLEMMQDIIDSCPHGSNTKKNIKTIMHNVFEYALQNNYVNKDYSEFIKVEYSEPVIEREIFTEKEIQTLWEMSDQWDVQVLLILLYSGMRVNELLKNKKENCNLEEGWIYVPKELAKNKQSIRYVPIHDKVYDFVKSFYERSTGDLMTNTNGTVIAYNNFVSRNLKRINEHLIHDHKMHDTRHTFITNAYHAKVDELCLKLIVGHTPEGITKQVYTHMDNAVLKREINKIK